MLEIHFNSKQVRIAFSFIQKIEFKRLGFQGSQIKRGEKIIWLFRAWLAIKWTAELAD